MTHSDALAKLKTLVERYGQRQVAEDFGLSNAYISYVLSGNLRLGPKLLRALGYTESKVVTKNPA